MSPRTQLDQGQPVLVRMEAAEPEWHPAAISDRQLLEFNDRLAKVRRLGDAFADLELSAQATDRLQGLRSNSG